MVTGVQSTEEGECSFMTYPALLWVAHAPSASLRCSAWSLLLLSCHGDLPLDGLVERGCRPGALLLHCAVGGHRPLSALDGNDGGQRLFNTSHKILAFISFCRHQKHPIQIRHLGKVFMDDRQKCEATSTKQTEKVPALELDPYRTCRGE